MNPKKIVVAGGPGSGKTTLINALKSRDFLCYDEISREIILNAQKEGIDQLFLKASLLFSQKLLEGRIQNYNDASKENESVVFFDRGIPDVLAYMDFIDDTYPQHFIEACQLHTYDFVFVLPPWESIFLSDNERYENFEQAQEIHQYLIKTYKRFGHQLTNVPFDTVEKRVDFVLETLNLQ